MLSTSPPMLLTWSPMLFLSGVIDGLSELGQTCIYHIARSTQHTVHMTWTSLCSDHRYSDERHALIKWSS
jgi:hypothetical protein